ncbi:MAG: dTMP kinase [Deltaproteobacteria bacterium]|nr:dTMP kinase [Deltaproteobacteria bacterium]
MRQKGATSANLKKKHEYPGKLIIVEGIDGSGKSTQMYLLQQWLIAQGYPVFRTEWNSSILVKKMTKEGKKKKNLTPQTFSIIHAADFADRLQFEILPPLKAGMIVLADRYVYTAFARDGVRGVNPQWIRNLYQFAVKPDLAFYFKTPIQVSIDRILSGRPKLKYYEAGMDLNLAPTPEESFTIFQTRILKEYQKMIKEFGLTVMDATKEINEQQTLMREIVTKELKGFTTKRRNYERRQKVFWRRFGLS